jgi:membrane protease subunit HflC
MKYAVATVIIVLLVAIFGTQTMYTQDEIQLSVVTRFGEIKQVYTQPGLKFKAPFVDQKNYFDKRLLYRDLPEATLPDAETQFLNIDAYARYRIGHQENGVVVTSASDVESFFETLTTLERAGERVERVVASALRDEVSTRRREEIIGATVKTVVAEVSDPAIQVNLEEALTLDNEADLGEEVTVPSLTRQEILDNVRTSAEVQIAQANLGLTLVDVRIKRADFPEETQQAIFTRMRAERERLAREFRAEGQRERDRIEADVNRQVAIILAEAEKEGNITRGEGEAQSISILAEALGKDPEFYAFRRSLEAYTNSLSQNSTLVLSSESDLFRFLESTVPSDDSR